MTDDLTRADLDRELHYMASQVEQHGFPGTRAVLAELERLRGQNAALIARVGEHHVEIERLRIEREQLRGALTRAGRALNRLGRVDESQDALDTLNA